MFIWAICIAEIMINTAKQIAHTDNDKEVNKSNLSSYNEELVVRGKLYFDLGFRSRWDDDLKRMNNGKVVAPYKFPLFFIEKMAILHQYIDYRGLEGIARELADYEIIPYFSDYTTLWRRIHDFKPELDKPEYKEIEIASEGTGMKISNAGAYRLDKYGTRKKNKYIVIVISSDVRTKKLLKMDVYIQGENTEIKVVKNHIMDLEKDFRIIKFYGDGAYDNYSMFNILGEIGADKAIKIRKNASMGHYNYKGKERRRAVKEYNNLGYKEWSKKNEYGKRWNATEGINSSVKRKFGENLVSKLPEIL